MWYRWTEAISEKKVFYGYTLGNHDSEADLTRRQIVDLDMLHPYSLTKQAEAPGYGASTFVIPVMSSKNPEEIVMNLWFFDSEDYNCLGVKGYGCVVSRSSTGTARSRRSWRRPRAERSLVWRSCTLRPPNTCSPTT